MPDTNRILLRFIGWPRDEAQYGVDTMLFHAKYPGWHVSDKLRRSKFSVCLISRRYETVTLTDIPGAVNIYSAGLELRSVIVFTGAQVIYFEASY